GKRKRGLSHVSNPSAGSLPEGFAQLSFENLARILPRQVIFEFNDLRNLIARQMRAQMVQYILHRRFRSRHRLDEGRKPLSILSVGNAENSAVADVRMPDQHILDFRGINVYAPG